MARPHSTRFASNQYTMTSPEDRFWAYVDKGDSPDSCWIWTGTPSSYGYGRFTIRGDEFLAHKLSWEWVNGPVPDDLCVCHDCPSGDNPLCVNPAHLFLGTHAENRQDCVAKGRQAKGERHGTHTKPESLARGERSGRHTKPESYATGDAHWTRRKPDAVAAGEGNGNSRLTWDIVRAIRSRYAAGGVSQQSLANEYGIHQTAVSSVIRRETWRE